MLFAYLHPAATPPFATFHPTAANIQGTAYGLVSTTGSILAATNTSLSIIAQPSESVASTGPPAAYASYCGLGFSGGEQERSKAFRSLLGLANHGLQYLPPTLEGGKGKGGVHAVGLLSVDQGSGKPDRLITYLAGNGSAEWELSNVVQDDLVALWDAESKHAQTITSKPTVRLTCNSSSAVQTLQIVHLFEFAQDGSQTFIGVLDDPRHSKSQWKFSPERTETEEYIVDEVVSSPAPDKGGKTLGEISDSGETVESSGITSDFTSDADMETLGTSVDEVDEETIGKKVNADVEGNEQAPVAGSHVSEPDANEEDAPSADPEPVEPTNEPTSAPKKSILRFFWITLSLLNSLWWGTISWFRQWTSRRSTETIASTEEDQPDVEDEQTPLIREVCGQSVSAICTHVILQVDDSQNYASISQETLQPDITEPAEGEPEAPTETVEPPVESQIETIRVPETRKTMFPAQISISAFSHDVFLLTNAFTASDLVGEIRNKGNVGEWQSVALVEENVAPTSEMKLLRLPLEEEAEIRVRLA